MPDAQSAIASLSAAIDGAASWAGAQLAVKGGPGSGNFDHAGRPGEVGGSSSGSGSSGVRSEDGKARIAIVEHGLQTKSIEHAVVMDNDGNTIWSKSGTKDSVEFYGYEIGQMKDAVFTHNHPGVSGNLSFSLDDVILASKGEIREMRVVGRNQKAVIKPASGKWPNSDDLLRAYDDYRRSPGVGSFPDQHFFFFNKAASLGLEYKRYDFKRSP